MERAVELLVDIATTADANITEDGDDTLNDMIEIRSNAHEVLRLLPEIAALCHAAPARPVIAVVVDAAPPSAVDFDAAADACHARASEAADPDVAREWTVRAVRFGREALRLREARPDA